MSVSSQHALLAQMFKEALPTLMRWARIDDLAEYAGNASLADPTFTDVEPIESRADALVLHRDTPEFFAIGEVQSSIDPAKQQVWPWYWAQAHKRERCRGILFIIATNSRVANWARRLTAPWADSPMMMVVIDSQSLPDTWTPSHVRQDLPGAMMALFLSDNTTQEHVLTELIWTELQRRQLQGVIDKTTFTKYTTFMLNSTSPALRAQIREYHMTISTWVQDQIEAGREKGRQEGRQEGREKGRQEGREKGRQEGLSLGRTEAARQNILRLVDKRNQILTHQSQKRLKECNDFAQLEQWFDYVIDQKQQRVELP